MRIALAADHAGFELKAELCRELERLGHEVHDFGTHDAESCDYPDYAIPAVQSLVAGEADRTILVCGNGIGMGMTANRIAGARAAVGYSKSSAATTRAHHDSNVLCLGAREFPPADLLEFARIWLETPFDAGRHERRVAKFESLS